MTMRRTSVNPRFMNDFAINPASKLPPHWPLQGLSSTEGIAPLEGNRAKIRKRAKTPFSGVTRAKLSARSW
eukprot:459563-Pyramimonas_sp.AAC.1